MNKKARSLNQVGWKAAEKNIALPAAPGNGGTGKPVKVKGG